MQKFIIAIAMILVLTGPVSGAEKTFDALDKDKDGRISQREYLDAAAKTFNKLDKDGSGHLDGKELKALSEADRKDWLAEMDKNGDGRIDRNEFQTEALKRFSTADADENRYLDSREWSKWQTQQRAGALVQFSF
ncbi:MAG: EF-hand domain-containing protein [Pseudomonadota bacterium]